MIKTDYDKTRKNTGAYKEYLEWVLCYVDTDGWCHTRKSIRFDEIKKDIEIETHKNDSYWWRPKSLQGIETNNGWIKIESEDDLPKNGYYEVVVRSTGEITRASLDNEYHTKSLVMYYSHYQPIIKPQLPIY